MALLKLTNFDDHPEDPGWLVFRFGDADLAREFQEGLDGAGISCETNNDGPPHLVGVRQRHREAAVRINYTVLGRHRRPFIGDGFLRWALLAFMALLLLLAVLGWLRNG